VATAFRASPSGEASGPGGPEYALIAASAPIAWQGSCSARDRRRRGQPQTVPGGTSSAAAIAWWPFRARPLRPP
jgi:hypothetical protein